MGHIDLSKIRFVREYEFYNETWLDVIYTSGRLYSMSKEKAYKNVLAFMESKTPKKQYDRVFKRDEIIYE